MSFRFKQFLIEDHRCAQKVGTDGVLLGAWTAVSAGDVLDVGSGSGLVTLMMAQRMPEARFWGIDIDADSVEQARENAAASRWADRICFEEGDFTSFDFGRQFDAIVSNPPFFEKALECPDKRRAAARHSSALPLQTLAERSGELLREGGRLTVILPYEATADFIFHCQTTGLTLERRCDIKTVERKAVRRCLLQFVKAHIATYTAETLTLLDADGKRTAEHEKLTKDYYLDK